MSFANFHKNNNDINELREKFNKLNGKTNNNQLDETYWTTNHVMGPDGKGEAIIRFLPAPPDGNGGQEPDNIVKYFNFSFTKNGKWYINRGRNSINPNEPDPANDYNKSIWARKDLTKEQKIKLLANRGEFYIANIFVVKDPNRPENEGKVFRWQFGRQIYNMINGKLFPEFETDKPVNVFDIENGADFIFRVTTRTIPDSNTGQLKKVPTYENSKFADVSKRWSPEEFDKIWEQEYSLQSEISADKCKPYDDLKREFDRVMNSDSKPKHDESDISEMEWKAPATQKSEPSKPLKEELDDDLPWDLDDDKNTKQESKSKTSDSSDVDIDDWFNNMK